MIQQCIELCRNCAEECLHNARLCKDKGLDKCAAICIACAAACMKAVALGYINMDVFEECADACNGSTNECDMHGNIHCGHCADVCNECQEACTEMLLQAAALK